MTKEEVEDADTKLNNTKEKKAEAEKMKLNNIKEEMKLDNISIRLYRKQDIS